MCYYNNTKRKGDKIMNLTNMTMEELFQMQTELSNEIDRRVKAEEQTAIKEFIEAFTKLNQMAITVTYEDYDDTYTLINPDRFHFTSL
jgi:histidinol dehydrogenase